MAVNENREVAIGAWWSPWREETDGWVHRITVRAEKTSLGVERTENYTVKVILEKLSVPGGAKIPCPRFEEWTSDGKGSK